MAKREKARLSRFKEEAEKSNNFQPGDKVVGYFRDSGGDGQDRSVDEQRAEWHRACQQQNLVPFREFAVRIFVPKNLI
jgi:hypothetical protein